jgi:carbon monoxide dehydrogenase subunit G
VKQEHQVEISSPVSRVFAYMDDVDREREWQPALIEAEKTPPGETAVGTRKRYVSEFMGRRIENTYVTTHFEPDRRVAYETTSDSAARAKMEVRFEPVEAGTRVTVAFEGTLTGPLRLIPRPLLESVYRKELKAALALLKQRLEGSP